MAHRPSPPSSAYPCGARPAAGGPTVRIIITGPDDLDDKKLVNAKLDALTEGLHKPVIVLAAPPRGAALLAYRFAMAWGYTAELHYPDLPPWGRPRRGSAGEDEAMLERAQDMVNSTTSKDACVWFRRRHDEEPDVVRLARAKGLTVRTIRVPSWQDQF